MGKKGTPEREATFAELEKERRLRGGAWAVHRSTASGTPEWAERGDRGQSQEQEEEGSVTGGQK